MAKFRDLCLELLGYAPFSKKEVLEKVIENYVSPERHYSPIDINNGRQIKFHPTKFPFVIHLDTCVFGHIVQRCYFDDIEYWRNSLQVLERVERGELYATATSYSRDMIAEILENKVCFKTNREKAIRVINSAIGGFPNLHFKQDPPLRRIWKKYTKEVVDEEFSYEDLSQLFISEREKAKILLTYDLEFIFRLMGTRALAMTPEKFLSYIRNNQKL